MASSGGIGALNAARVADMEAMSVDQLRPLKEQTDLEVNLQDNHNKIRTASTRLDIPSTALHDLFLRHQGIYLPLSSFSLCLCLPPRLSSLCRCRFEVSILPKIRMSLKAFNNTKDIVWNLHNEHTNERTTIAFLRIDEQVKFSENRVR
ncbi:putative prefoldin subunit 5 [Platanthera guangdongensis]|uniref:Prefoldin subunit 5 n=1 Tax=Platanthera guangdongensis TaxID=2320717 RepID=A0ABR2LDK3_9ASPA